MIYKQSNLYSSFHCNIVLDYEVEVVISPDKKLTNKIEKLYTTMFARKILISAILWGIILIANVCNIAFTFVLSYLNGVSFFCVTLSFVLNWTHKYLMSNKSSINHARYISIIAFVLLLFIFRWVLRLRYPITKYLW